MRDACCRSIVYVSEELGWSPIKRERVIMPTKNRASPDPFHRKLLSPGPFEKRGAAGKVEKPAPVPHRAYSRDARGSLEIFGARAHKGSTPVFSSPAWRDALETAENLLQISDSPCRTESLFGDESDVSSEKSKSSLWKTKSQLQPPGSAKLLPRPRALNPGAKITTSPVSITLEYGGSDHEFSLDNDSDDVEVPVPASYSSAGRPRRVPLTPTHSQPVVAIYEEPVDIEEQWQAILNGTAPRIKLEEDFEKECEEDENWQGVLDGGVEGPVVEGVVDGAESMLRRSIGGSSEFLDEVRSERALQWGYGLPVRTSTDAASNLSWRASTSRSSQSRSSEGSNSSQTIPRVAKDVRDAITSFNLAFVVCDATGTDPTYSVLYASGGFFKMTGYEADEVIGSNCRFLQGPGTDLKEVGKIRKALKAGEAYSGKILNYRKDGTSFWNVLSISPIRNDDGEVIKYIGMQAEASEKKKRKKLKEEKSKVPEVITAETPKQDPASKPPRPLRASPASNPDSPIPELALPPLKNSVDALPRISDRYSLYNSRQSNESAADWHALARLRAEIVSTARSLEAPGAQENKEKEKMKEVTKKRAPRSKRVVQLLRKLNTKISERLRAPEIRYVDFEQDDRDMSTADESDIETRRCTSVNSRSSMDFRLATPSDFGKRDIPERAERMSSSHCAVPIVTHGGKSQFVIIH